ncbi:MAG: mandelate racemase/muconate lactonizing enzyme family protein, partial [Pelagibacteraceae bacterium]
GLFPSKPMLEFDTTEENIFISDLSEEKFDIFDQVKNNNGFVKPLEAPGIGLNPNMDFVKKFEVTN